MYLTVLGCRSGMPADGQPSSGYLVDTPGARLLLDCGPGVATALSAVAAPRTLDAVVISHLHADHCYDLLALGKSLLSTLVEMRGAPRAQAEEFRSVPLYVPDGAGERFARWAALFPVVTVPLLDRAFDVGFEVREYRPGDTFAVGDCTITLHELQHVVPNCGIRVAGPSGTLAYTGDTGMTPALNDLATGADVLLAEATLAEPDRSGHGHLCAAEAGQIAAEARAGELVLTHFASGAGDWLEALARDAGAAFAGPIRLAAPDLRIPVGDRM